MSKMIFVNLPVRDLAAATHFYEAIGCVKNEQFSGDTSSSMVWSDSIYFHLLTHDFFATHSAKPIAKAHETTGMLLALSCDSRDGVDAMAAAAASAGGKVDVLPPQDMGFMYLRKIEDPDGHVLEPMWMDMSAVEDAS